MIAIFIVAAVLCAGAAFWVLRAYHKQGASARRPLAICGAVALFALTTYLLVGQPALPDAPFRERLTALKHRDPSSFTVDEALAVLDQAGKDHPRDALPHLYAGDIYLRDGRPEQAARAFDAALRRQPDLSEAKMGLARALVRIDRNRVSPQALALFQEVAAGSADPAPWIYQAMAATQTNRPADARRFWGEALNRMGPDDPRREMARTMSRGQAPGEQD